ncbi:MAG TPA: hypothetical protein VEX39_15585, partial [Thermoleophilaceae bacterium]|nr:hypothetical protein [Thermoleophilaceae bacterium]
MRRGLTAVVALLVLGVAGDARAATWRQPQPARSADGIEMVGPRARYTADGALVAAWSARDYGANWVERDGWAPIPRAPLRVAVRAPGREAFGAARTLDANASAQVGLATDAVGGTVLAWVGGNRKLRVSRRPPGGTFGPVREIATAFSVALAMNRRGDAALAYIGAGDAPWISHAPPGGDFGEPVRAGTVGTVTSHTTPGVGVAGDGRAVVAWQDESDGLVARAALRAPGGPVGAPMRLSPPGRQGQSPRVAVDEAGRAMVVWTDGDRPFTGGWVTAAHMRGSCCFSAPARVGMGATWFGSQITTIEGSGALIWTDRLPPGSPAVAGADMGSGGLTPVVGFPRQGGARLAANARGEAVLAAGAEGGGLSLGRRAPGAGFGPSQRVVCEPSPWGRNASVWPDVVAVS